MPKTNIFVLGLEESNLTTLRDLPHDDYEFHPLLDAERLIHGEEIDLPALLDEAERVLDEFPGPVDAITGYWDFPVTSMVPILCRRRGLPAPDLQGIVTCEHKYWSRLVQQEVSDEVPGFAILDLEEDADLPPELDYPVWLKPVKSASSELAFRVTDRDGLRDAMAQIRDGIDRFGEPFEHVMGHVELPARIADVGGTACLAEEAVDGRQVTVEGYVIDGRVEVYGVIDSINYPDTASFLRYQYPARLPERVTDRLVDSARTVIAHMGLGSSTFNVEYFWDPDSNRISLLEINPRLSQSHAQLFEHVDGVANHEALLSLALGRTPELPHREGEFAVAAKCFVRHFADGVVTRCPTDEEVARVERELPGVSVQLTVGEGDRLSDLVQQDSYSYELATVHIGAGDQEELVQTYERCLALLPFEVDEAEGG